MCFDHVDWSSLFLLKYNRAKDLMNSIYGKPSKVCGLSGYRYYWPFYFGPTSVLEEI